LPGVFLLRFSSCFRSDSECACDEPLSVTADSASRHQFSPRVAPTSRVCLGEHRYDPQSSKGAEQ
ncbi:hypothetical protein KUCAC02_007392, partial [Chaenocephalus aceratus]